MTCFTGVEGVRSMKEWGNDMSKSLKDIFEEKEESWKEWRISVSLMKKLWILKTSLFDEYLEESGDMFFFGDMAKVSTWEIYCWYNDESKFIWFWINQIEIRCMIQHIAFNAIVLLWC